MSANEDSRPDVLVPKSAPIVPPELIDKALTAQSVDHHLPAPALQLIADVAAQSPLVAQWLSGWLSAQRDGTLPQVRLVVDAAHLKVADGGEVR